MTEKTVRKDYKALDSVFLYSFTFYNVSIYFTV